MRKILVNKTLSPIEINDTGIRVGLTPYIIPTQDFNLWASSSDLVDKIISGEIVVSDGENELITRIGIALIQDNYIVVNDYYCLNDENGLLMGNGKILFLNDEFYNTDNVPEYMDEDIVEDEV